ncbi:MAG: 3'(2'),5'-bisphosphate nucleotidase CysQ [Bacteroidales bacterium]|nr:3'(2'),5'-bisphosphate nucleotidase CysQ [Bacteroidales bacterium]
MDVKERHRNNLLTLAIQAALAAGKEILKVYGRSDFEVELKSDNSPLTLADRIAHQTITEILASATIPLLSEESVSIPFRERKAWKTFWLVDPLDGTKEFIRRNGEFTVNIALIENHSPTKGVIYVPVLDELYAGDVQHGAWKITSASAVAPADMLISGVATRLPVNHNSSPGIVASRSHLNPETSAFVEGMKRKYPDARIVSRGSSLKLCMIAEGSAGIYPRFAPTSEWDTAAGHAIVVASGGKVLLAANNDQSLRYNKENILNPWFIALSQNIQQTWYEHKNNNA